MKTAKQIKSIRVFGKLYMVATIEKAIALLNDTETITPMWKIADKYFGGKHNHMNAAIKALQN